MLDKLPVSAIEKLSSICSSEIGGSATGQVNLSKIGQRITETPALVDNRKQYSHASQPKDTST